jgi:GATA-binding protein
MADSLFFFFLCVGLYYKLHGTHRPTSMKKGVIKRRKRVPAASGTGVITGSSPGAEAVNGNISFLDTTITNGNDSDDRMSMSDEAAAEVLLGVGRRHKGLQAQTAHSDIGSRFETLKRDAEDDMELEDELEDEHDRSRRSKRARKTKRQSAKMANPDEIDELLDDDIGLTVTKADRSKKGRSPRGSGTQTPINLDASSLVQALQRQRELENMSEDRLNPMTQNFMSRGAIHLPPIGAALGLPPPSYPASRNPTAPSSRAHSHSPTSFSRSLHPLPTHSMMGQSHPHSMPILPSAYRSAPHPPSAAPSPPESHVRDEIPSAQSVPTLAELETHYQQLNTERRRLEEMLEKTDELLIGVKRGMEQLRPHRSPSGFSDHTRERIGHQHHHPHHDAPHSAFRLPSHGSSRTREQVWSIDNGANHVDHHRDEGHYSRR